MGHPPRLRLLRKAPWTCAEMFGKKAMRARAASHQSDQTVCVSAPNFAELLDSMNVAGLNWPAEGIPADRAVQSVAPGREAEALVLLAGQEERDANPLARLCAGRPYVQQTTGPVLASKVRGSLASSRVPSFRSQRSAFVTLLVPARHPALPDRQIVCSTLCGRQGDESTCLQVQRQADAAAWVGNGRLRGVSVWTGRRALMLAHTLSGSESGAV